MSKFSTPPCEESVGCNLIPMIDIMFLLLLFFMLGADMTIHENADVVLPKADKAQEDKEEKGGDQRSTVNVYHRHTSSASPCPVFDTKGICRDLDHWLIDIRGKEFNRETVKARLREIADIKREPLVPGQPKQLSAIRIMIRADHLAPFGYIQRVIEACAIVGIYKIEVGAAKPTPV